MTDVTQERESHHAFAKTMHAYEDAKAKSLRGLGIRPTGYSVGKVKPQLSDFIADVEITARRVLTEQDLQFFKTVYVDQLQVDPHTNKSEQYQRQHTRISSKLGRAFITRGIHPARIYFREVDVRQ